MREHFYCFQLVGNETSVKRMVASVYLVNARSQEQTLRVCICDDLPHVVGPFNEMQKKEVASELLQADLSLSVNYERTLTVTAAEISNHYENHCNITPNHEIAIPTETIWTAGATVIVDFKVQMLKANETTPVQISIMSQDDSGNDIPLSVPPRAHLSWHMKNVAGVTKLREAWEVSSDDSLSPQRRSWATRQGPQPFMSNYTNFAHKSVSMPRHVQPAYSKVEAVVQRKKTKMQEIEEQLKREEQRMKWEEERKRMIEERKPVHSATSSQSSDKKWSGSSLSSSYQDSDWNIVRDPRETMQPFNGSYSNAEEHEPLPSWAKGLGEDFNYDDVVVV